MLRNQVRLAVALIFLSLGGLLYADQQPASQVRDVTVYVTKTGDKYHNGGCRSLKESKIAILLSVAKTKYVPCAVCKPPR